MSNAQQLIEQRYQKLIEDESPVADFELLGVPINNGTPLFSGPDRLVIGFMNMQDRSQFEQDASAKGFEIDQLDADAYPEQVPTTYPFLAIVWK